MKRISPATAIALAALFFSLAGAESAAAKPVNATRAASAIRADKLDFPTAPNVDWCARKHYGTICGVSVSGCYVDGAFGDSVVTTRNVVWISRTRGIVSVAPLDVQPRAIVHVLYGTTCTPGDIASTPR